MDEKEKYLLHAKLSLFARKVDRAMQIIREALAPSERPLLSFSGGKDSIVMLDLAVKSGFKGELVFFKYGLQSSAETPTETTEIVDYYTEKLNLKCNTIECLGEFDCWDELGYFCLFPESDEEKRIFTKTNKDFFRKSLAFEKEYGCDLSLVGMRKAESNARKMMLLKKGPVYSTAYKKSKTCCPLTNFSNADIWSYIFQNDLKYPNCYDYPFLSRELIRNEPTLLYNEAIIRHGAVVHLRQMFPLYFEEIKRLYPNAVINF